MPKPEPFGYFRVEPFVGWTDCSETDEGAMALYDQAAVDSLERERDELLADAERYRWLREQNETLSADSFVVLSRDVECAHCESTWVGADLDAAIAAARKEKVDG